MTLRCIANGWGIYTEVNLAQTVNFMKKHIA
jgi:hypothetical protein